MFDHSLRVMKLRVVYIEPAIKPKVEFERKNRKI